MQNTLSEMWKKYNLLYSFKTELNKKGYSRDLYSIEVQLNLLIELIRIESNVVLEQFLQRTYYRLFKSINRGIEQLPYIISESDEGKWVLNPIEKDQEAWISNSVLIFTTKSNIAVFSKISRKNDGQKYQDGKYQ